MDSFDHIIVGAGLAGTLLAEELRIRGKRILVAEPGDIPRASAAANAILNPVHIRNRVLSWNTEKFFPFALKKYTAWQEDSPEIFSKKIRIFHVHADEEESVQWRLAYESSELFDYIEPNQQLPEEKGILNPAGGTILSKVLFIDIPRMLNFMQTRMKKEVFFLREKFDYAQLIIHPEQVKYKNFSAKSIIFCEGQGAVQNPWFKNIPFRLSKGESLLLDIPGLNDDFIFHRKYFLLRDFDGMFRFGSTYSWDSFASVPEEQTGKLLQEALKELTCLPFQVLDQKAGVRPGIADRRPVIGFHPQHPQIGIFNGLGSKGLLLAPYFTSQFAECLTKGGNIAPTVDVMRFRKRLMREENSPQ